MFMRKKVLNNVVAVLFDDPPEISLRWSGKEYYNKEDTLIIIEDGKVCINEKVAEKYGLEIRR